MVKGLVFDTSVWIEYFKANPIYFTSCQDHLDRSSVYSMEIIFAELLQGARSGREVAIINGYYENIPQLDHRGQIFKAGLFAQKEGLIGKGIGLIDSIIIYTTINHGCQLWTLDKRIINYLDKDYLYQE